MLGLIGILLGIFLLIFLTWKGWHMGLATIVAAFAVILCNGMEIWPGISESYATSFKNFAGTWFLLFALGAIFGKVMDESGAASAISNFIVGKLGKKQIVLIILLTTAILAYGGISVFVIMFTMYPICMALFKEADIPRKLFPAMSICMAGTTCMTFLPGAPSVPNLVPTEALGTSIYAAPVIGTIGGILVFVMDYIFFTQMIRLAAKKGEHFNVAAGDTIADLNDAEQLKNLPSVWKAFMPIVVLIAGAFILMRFLKPSNYAVVTAMALACITGIVLMHDKFSAKSAVTAGFSNGFNSLVVTSSIMGFGGVVTASPTFTKITEWVLGLQMSPILLACVGINVICAITGSASGGITIFWNTLADYMISTGINSQILHRITCIACSGLDAMPYSSGIVLANEVGKCDLKDSYKYMFVSNAAIPLVGLVIAIILYHLGLC